MSPALKCRRLSQYDGIAAKLECAESDERGIWMKRVCAFILALVMTVMLIPVVSAQSAPGTVKIGSFEAVDLSQYVDVWRQEDGTWVAVTKSWKQTLLDEEFRVLFASESGSIQYICPGRYAVDVNGAFDQYGTGVVDRQGKQIIPCKYEGIEWCEESNCFYGSEKSGTVIFNADGTVRFRCGIYSEPFTCGGRTVCMYKDTNGLVGLKDLNGNVVLKAAYDDIRAVEGGIMESAFDRTTDSLGRCFVKKNGVWGLVDRNGKTLISPEFDVIWDVQVFRDDEDMFIIKVEKNGAYGLYLSDGRKLLDCVYSSDYGLDYHIRDNTLAFKTWDGNSTTYYFDRDTWTLVRTEEPGERYVSDGRYIEVDSSGLSWLVDESGRRVTSRGYSGIYELGVLDGQCGYLEIRHNVSGRQAVGVLDVVSGKEVVPLSTALFDVTYDDVVEGRLLLQGTGKWGWGHWGSYDPVTDRMVYDYQYVEFRGGMVQDSNRCWGVIDRYTGEVIIPCKYTELRYANGIYYAYRGTMSIFDEEGKLLLPAMYPNAIMISRDRFAVEDSVGNVGLCDGNGKLLTPQTYDGMGRFHDSDYILVDRGHGEGLLTMDGEVVIPAAEDQELSMEGDGWLIVCRQGKYYAINLNGQTPGEMEKPEDVNGSSVILGRFRGYRLPEGYTIFGIDGTEGAEGMVKVRYTSQFEEKYGFADKTGRIVVPCEYDSVNNFHEGLALVEKLGQYGYIDTTGKLVIPLIYDAASDFSQGYAAVANGYDVGYIDRTGQPLRLAKTGEALRCDNAMDFDENGVAVVRGLYTSNRRFDAVIDTKGNIVAEIKHSFDSARSVSGTRFILRSDYYWDRLIDRSGNSLFVGEYRMGAPNNSVYSGHNSLVFAENGLAPAQSYETRLWGFIDLNGKLVIDQVYNYVSGFRGDLAVVTKIMKDGTEYCGIVNSKGKEVVPVEKERCNLLPGGLIFYRNMGSTYGVLTDRTGKAVYTNYQITEAYYDDFGGRFGYIDQRGVACWAWLDLDGKILGTMEKPSSSVSRLSSELIKVGSSKGYGIVNVFGAELLPNVCSRIYPLEGGGFAASVDNIVYILPEMGAAVSFEDLKGCESYMEAIEFVVSRGLMKGISATKLDPDGNLNRAAIVTMLWRMAGKPKGEYKGTFSDVTSSAYYAVPAEWGNATGIVMGYTNGKFGHGDNVTREQAVTFLYRYVQSCGKGYGANWSYKLTHSDADQIHDYALEAMSWCVQNGVFEPEADGKLNPRGVASRLETAVMFYHVYDLINN